MTTFARSLRDLLAGKRGQWADLSTAVYVGPHGLDGHRVEIGGAELIVPSAAGAVTFRPGDAVLVGQLAGNNQRVIIGKPPAGFGGQSAFSLEILETTVPALILERVDPAEIEASAAGEPVVLFGRDLARATRADAVLFNETLGRPETDTRVEIELGAMVEPPPPEATEGQTARDATVTLDPSVEGGEVLPVRVRAGIRSSTLARALTVTAPPLGAVQLARADGSNITLSRIEAGAEVIESTRSASAHHRVVVGGDGGTTIYVMEVSTLFGFHLAPDSILVASGLGWFTGVAAVDLAGGGAVEVGRIAPAAGWLITAPVINGGRAWYLRHPDTPANPMPLELWSAALDLSGATLEHSASITGPLALNIKQVGGWTYDGTSLMLTCHEDADAISYNAGGANRFRVTWTPPAVPSVAATPTAVDLLGTRPAAPLIGGTHRVDSVPLGPSTPAGSWELFRQSTPNMIALAPAFRAMHVAEIAGQWHVLRRTAAGDGLEYAVVDPATKLDISVESYLIDIDSGVPFPHAVAGAL